MKGKLTTEELGIKDGKEGPQGEPGTTVYTALSDKPQLGGVTLDMDMPERCYFKSCTFEDSFSTAMEPNGGESSTIDGCYFKDNGYRDPSSQIDWEDGRQRNKGHILKNCTFVGGGPVNLIGADGTVVRNNTFRNCQLSNGDEVQNSRIFLNQFIGNKKTTITSKTDMVFSQNFGMDGATYQITNVGSVNFAVREAENVFE